MRLTGLVLDPRYRDHRPGEGHPERPERVEALLDLLEAPAGWTRIEPRPATREELGWNHDPRYVERVAATAGRARVAFDPDTQAGPRSYETARLAAGGVLALLEAIVAGRVDHGFALVRPPGHHAERARAMGFCLFNNVAVGAHWLRRRAGLERVLVVDWDVHHGNGTQHSFEADPHVLFVSLHQWPHYPGTGAAEEVGRGAGRGFTVNVPLPAGCGDSEYLAAFHHLVLPIARRFEPQFVLVSAGFDAHARDPLGGMRVSAEGFAAMTHLMMTVAQAHAQGRLALVLEGGYDLQGLKEAVIAVLEQLSGQRPAPHVPAPSVSLPALERVREFQRAHWAL